MRGRGRGRAPAGRARCGYGGQPAYQIIVSITDDGGLALVTVAAPITFIGGEHIFIGGTTNSAYNGGPFEVTSIGPSSFYIGVVYSGDSFGGSWHPA